MLSSLRCIKSRTLNRDAAEQQRNEQIAEEHSEIAEKLNDFFALAFAMYNTARCPNLSYYF